MANFDAQRGYEQPWHGIYAGETRLHARLLTDARRTTDPDEADFFYVPVWVVASCDGIGGFGGSCVQKVR